MSYDGWKPYVPVAARRATAQRLARQAARAGEGFEPVTISGRLIARTFWGKAWCSNLEAYSDHQNRLPRGRTYVRNGSVIDLKITPGRLSAQVVGSSVYEIEIHIEPLAAARWQELVRECTGSIATLVELLQGKFSQAVMERMCAPRTGLFPEPDQIDFRCSCPDWAHMCKHVVAALYGVGARLDEQPELLFALRQVDAAELLAAKAADLPARAGEPASSRILDDAALTDVFGIEIAEPAAPAARPRGKRAAATAGAADAGSAAGKTAGKAVGKAEAQPRAGKAVDKAKAAPKTAKAVGKTRARPGARKPARPGPGSRASRSANGAD